MLQIDTKNLKFLIFHYITLFSYYRKLMTTKFRCFIFICIVTNVYDVQNSITYVCSSVILLYMCINHISCQVVYPRQFVCQSVFYLLLYCVCFTCVSLRLTAVISRKVWRQSLVKCSVQRVDCIICTYCLVACC